MNERKLKALIVEYDGNQRNLASAMGVSIATLNKKIKGHGAHFNIEELKFLKQRYQMSQRTFNLVFFDDEVSCVTQSKLM